LRWWAGGHCEVQEDITVHVLLTCRSCARNVSLDPEQVHVEVGPLDEVAVYQCPLQGCGAWSRRPLVDNDLLELHRVGVPVPADRLMRAARARLLLRVIF